MNPNLSDLEATYYLCYFLYLIELFSANSYEWRELSFEFHVMKYKSVNDL